MVLLRVKVQFKGQNMLEEWLEKTEKGKALIFPFLTATKTHFFELKNKDSFLIEVSSTISVF